MEKHGYRQCTPRNVDPSVDRGAVDRFLVGLRAALAAHAAEAGLEAAVEAVPELRARHHDAALWQRRGRRHGVSGREGYFDAVDCDVLRFASRNCRIRSRVVCSRSAATLKPDRTEQFTGLSGITPGLHVGPRPTQDWNDDEGVALLTYVVGPGVRTGARGLFERPRQRRRAPTVAAAGNSRLRRRSRSAARSRGWPAPAWSCRTTAATIWPSPPTARSGSRPRVDAGSPYNITVRTQPASPSQTCTVANAAGTATANVTSVTVTCSTGSFSVGGTVSGLAGSGLVLRNNGGDDLPIASNGSFTFATELASGSAFAVTVATQPTRPSQTCTVADASGTIGGGDVRTVKVTCSTNKYTIRGTVSGLQGQRPGAAEQRRRRCRRANGRRLRVSDADRERLGVQGRGEDASHDSGAGVLRAERRRALSRIATSTTSSSPARCASSRSAARSPVCRGSGMVLANNGGDRFNPTADGPFTFPTAVLSGSSYRVTVTSPPVSPLQLCRVSNDSGVVVDANVTNVLVECFTFGIGVGGTVSGLNEPGSGVAEQRREAGDRGERQVHAAELAAGRFAVRRHRRESAGESGLQRQQRARRGRADRRRQRGRDLQVIAAGGP